MSTRIGAPRGVGGWLVALGPTVGSPDEHAPARTKTPKQAAPITRFFTD
jgi:hypothetical protein